MCRSLVLIDGVTGEARTAHDFQLGAPRAPTSRHSVLSPSRPGQGAPAVVHSGEVEISDLGAWGQVSLEHRLGGGARNDVWAVTVDGRPCVARASRRSDAALAWELDLMDWARDHGLRTPLIIPTSAGSRSQAGITVFERVSGRSPESDSDWSAVEQYLVGLHELSSGWEQRPGFLAAEDLLVEPAGGDVDLRTMPDEAVDRCREAWSRLRGRDRCVVHGDPGHSSIFMVGDEVVLIDWDESRVDVPLFDLAALPDAASPLPADERWLAQQAASGWEAAVSWTIEPEYARRRLNELGGK